MEPFELLYANVLQWVGWKSAVVITSVYHRIKAWLSAESRGATNKNQNVVKQQGTVIIDLQSFLTVLFACKEMGEHRSHCSKDPNKQGKWMAKR
jgi:hypothetical protein